MKEKMGPLSVVAAGVMWGMISPFVRHLTATGLDSLQICLVRFVIAALILLACIALWDHQALRIRLKDIWCFMGTGIVSLAFFSWCYFTTIQASEVSIAVVLVYTAPIIVIALSALLFHESITTVKVIALILTFVGTVLVAGLLGGSYSMTIPVFLIGLGSGFGYALYSIFGRFAIQRGYHTMTITFYTNVFAAVGVLFICRPMQVVERINTTLLLWGVGIALTCTVVPYLLYTYGLSRMESGKASILTTIEPMVGAIIGIFFYHESHGLTKILGMACILAAVVVLNLGGIHRPHHAVHHHHYHLHYNRHREDRLT